MRTQGPMEAIVRRVNGAAFDGVSEYISDLLKHLEVLLGQLAKDLVDKADLRQQEAAVASKIIIGDLVLVQRPWVARVRSVGVDPKATGISARLLPRLLNRVYRVREV